MRSRFAGVVVGLVSAAMVFSVVPAQAGPDDTPVAKVGPLTVTQGELERRLQQVPGLQLASFGKTPDEVKRAFLERVVVPELLLTLSARAKKLDERDDVRLRLRDILRQALVAQIRKQQGDPAGISSDEIARYYAENREKFQTPERVQIWRIATATKDDAQKILDEVKKPGGDKRWKDLARERSTDKATAERGGDLGFVGPDGSTSVPTVRVEAGLFEAAKRVQNGDFVPEPVAEAKGWAVVWRRGSTPAVNRPLEAEMGTIRALLARQKVEGEAKAIVAKLRAESVRDVSYELLSVVEISGQGEVSPRKKPGVVKTKALGKPQPSSGRDGLR